MLLRLSLLITGCFLMENIAFTADLICIQNLEWIGNTSVQHELLQRTANVRSNQCLSENELHVAAQRLRNMQIFQRVEFALHEPGDLEKYEALAARDDFIRYPGARNVHLEFKVDDKWTTIPIFKFGGGGGSQFWTLGVYDVNSFGRLLELGAQLELLNNQPSLVLWSRIPFAFGVDGKLGIELWQRRQIEDTYSLSGDFEATEIWSVNRFHIFHEWDLSDSWRMTNAIEFRESQTDSISDSVSRPGRTDQLSQESADKTQHALYRMIMTHDQVEHYLLSQRGSLHELGIEHASALNGKSQDYWSIQGRIQYFFLPSDRHNIAMQAVFGLTSAEGIRDQFKLSGLEHVRGVRDGRFRGPAIWYVNLEDRIRLYQHRFFEIQGVLFTDLGQNTSSRDDKELANPVHTIGGELRWSVPSVYRLNLRFDYAVSVSKHQEQGFSFGLQQFF